jgi:hypothetical protein
MCEGAVGKSQEVMESVVLPASSQVRARATHQTVVKLYDPTVSTRCDRLHIDRA